MTPPRSAEAMLADLEKILAGYRKHVGEHGAAAELRAQALADIKKLGYSEGDAVRWLDGKKPR